MELIVSRFREHVKGRTPPSVRNGHDGTEGHWLEKQMGISPNSKNMPDLLGFEMKKNSNKVSFGDFSASEYLFSRRKRFLERDFKMSRKEFMMYFGTAKNGRFSWSGKCVPKYGTWNDCGQKLVFNDDTDLCALYSYSMDTRENKDEFPDFVKRDLTIAVWKREKLEKHINSKFNHNGFFLCNKHCGVYDTISFGSPFNFDHFVENVISGSIIFDSGMHDGNSRNYSQFRSSPKDFWSSLVYVTYS